MSDPGSTPPPPPPPGLTPPPGYAAYTPTPAASVPVKRVGGLRTALLVLIGVFVVATLVQLAATPAIVDSARDFLDETISEDDFDDDVAAYGTTTLLTSASQLAIVVLTMIWLFRVAKNHQLLGRRLTWGPGWAIGGWFLPPLLYVIPLLMLRESWKASDPDAPPGDDVRWRRSRDTPLLWIWFALYVVLPIVFVVISFRLQFGVMGSDAEDIADSFDDQLGLLFAQGLTTVLAAISWGLLVRALTQRHGQLTGEFSRQGR